MDKALTKKLNITKILKALLFSYILTGILLILLAFGMYKLELSEAKISIGIIAVYVISCFVGGFITGKFVPSRKFIWGLVLGIVYFAVLTLISFAVNRELQGSIANLITTFVMCAGGGMLGGMVS